MRGRFSLNLIFSMLSNKQKGYLAQLARRGFYRTAAIARGRGETFDSTSTAFEGWRHSEVAKACGKLGLRCCGQMDYKRVEAHFLALLGEDGKAFEAHMRAETEPQRQAESKILGQLKEMGMKLGYAEGICRRMHHGIGLSEASPKQLWKVFFALRYQQKRAVMRNP